MALLNAWDHAAAAELFASNVDLDESLPRRAAAAAALVDRHGSLQIAGLRPTAITSGTIDVVGGSSGTALRITMEQSPFPGAPIQSYEVHE